MRIFISCFLMLVSGYAYSLCNCDGGNTYASSGNTGTYDFQSTIMSILSDQNCNRTWSQGSSSIGVYYVNGSEVNLSSSVTNQILAWMQSGTVPLAQVADLLYSSGINEKMVVLKMYRRFDEVFGCGGGNGDYDTYGVIMNFYYGGDISFNIPTLCSSKSYLFTELFSFYGNNTSYNNIVVTDSDGATMVNNQITFGQPFSSNTQVFLNAVISGQSVSRFWNKNIHEIGHALWLDVPTNLSNQSSDVNLSTGFCTWDAGMSIQIVGNGSYVTSNTPYFSPSIAGDLQHVIKIRTNNQGCVGDWNDTIIYVTPISSVVNAPIILLSSTFGPGEVGVNAKRDFPDVVVGTFPNTQTYPGGTLTHGKFHSVCSNTQYSFSVDNPNVNLTYEWKMLRHDSVFLLGNGVNKVISVNEAIDAQLQQNDSVNFSSVGFSNSDIPFYLDFGNSKYSDYAGDITMVLVRAKNILNNYSGWRKIFLGAVNKPHLEVDSNVQCYVGNPVLNVSSNVPVYLPLIDSSLMRFGYWDVNGDNVYELIGNNINYPFSSSNKINYFNAKIGDSIKYYVTTNGGSWSVISNQSSDMVCFSSPSLVPVVKSPILNVTWNNANTVSIGTPVLGIATGVYFDVNSDSISWDWSDDSNLFGSDTCWHYLNDLGDVSCVVTVLDSMGCSDSSSFIDYWFVPGTLSLDETVIKRIYPNPAISYVNVEAWLGDEVVVYSMDGKVIEFFTVNDKEKDVSLWDKRVVLYNKSRNSYVKLIIL